MKIKKPLRIISTADASVRAKDLTDDLLGSANEIRNVWHFDVEAVARKGWVVVPGWDTPTFQHAVSLNSLLDGWEEERFIAATFDGGTVPILLDVPADEHAIRVLLEEAGVVYPMLLTTEREHFALIQFYSDDFLLAGPRDVVETILGCSVETAWWMFITQINFQVKHPWIVALHVDKYRTLSGFDATALSQKPNTERELNKYFRSIPKKESARECKEEAQRWISTPGVLDRSLVESKGWSLMPVEGRYNAWDFEWAP